MDDGGSARSLSHRSRPTRGGMGPAARRRSRGRAHGVVVAASTAWRRAGVELRDADGRGERGPDAVMVARDREGKGGSSQGR